jgi:hypothetical protein
MSPNDTFDAASPRFVVDTLEIDGVPHVRMTDPVLGITVTTEEKGRTLLRYMFRGAWMQQCST